MTLKAKKKLLLFKKWQKALACHLCSWLLKIFGPIFQQAAPLMTYQQKSLQEQRQR